MEGKIFYESMELECNNGTCAILRVKEDQKVELISTGVFNGDEDMIRVNKGNTKKITVYRRNGSHYSFTTEACKTSERKEQKNLVLEALKRFFVDMRKGKVFVDNAREVTATIFTEDMVMVSDQGETKNFHNMEELKDYYKELGYMIPESQVGISDDGWKVEKLTLAKPVA